MNTSGKEIKVKKNSNNFKIMKWHSSYLKFRYLGTMKNPKEG